MIIVHPLQCANMIDVHISRINRLRGKIIDRRKVVKNCKKKKKNVTRSRYMLRKILVIRCQCSGKENRKVWQSVNDGSFPPWYVSCFLQDHRGSSHPRPTCNVTSKKPQPSKICRETIFTKCCNRFKISRRRKLTILVEKIFIENDFSIFF